MLLAACTHSVVLSIFGFCCPVVRVLGLQMLRQTGLLPLLSSLVSSHLCHVFMYLQMTCWQLSRRPTPKKHNQYCRHRCRLDVVAPIVVKKLTEHNHRGTKLLKAGAHATIAAEPEASAASTKRKDASAIGLSVASARSTGWSVTSGVCHQQWTLSETGCHRFLALVHGEQKLRSAIELGGQMANSMVLSLELIHWRERFRCNGGMDSSLEQLRTSMLVLCQLVRNIWSKNDINCNIGCASWESDVDFVANT